MKELRKKFALPIFKLYLWLSGQSWEEFLRPHLPRGTIIGDDATRFRKRFEAVNTLAMIAKIEKIPMKFWFSDHDRVLAASRSADRSTKVPGAKSKYADHYKPMDPIDAIMEFGGAACIEAIQKGHCNL